ncbi:MAG: LytTR family DNA-binding domain-containing protein, partial [Clostridia bacterium]
MNVAICDDDLRDGAQLKAILAARRREWRYESYASGEALLDACVRGAGFDLIFLDVFMDGMSGMEAAHALRRLDSRAALVFLTNSRDFAVESYEVEALSYLVKPIDEVKLMDVLRRFETTWRPKSILIGDRLFVVKDIVYMESKDKKVQFAFRGGSFAQITARLDEVEAQLTGGNYLRSRRTSMPHTGELETPPTEDNFLRNPRTSMPHTGELETPPTGDNFLRSHNSSMPHTGELETPP